MRSLSVYFLLLRDVLVTLMRRRLGGDTVFGDEAALFESLLQASRFMQVDLELGPLGGLKIGLRRASGSSDIWNITP